MPTLNIPFRNAYLQLPDLCYARATATPVKHPSLIVFNDSLAAELGISFQGLKDEQLAAIFSGNTLPEGAVTHAWAYSGHQFGHFNPNLGDGRAILLGDLVDQLGQLRDIQLKGAGRTPFSRNGDGRAAIGPVLREYLLCEAMHALGVPTTRALAAVSSGEAVWRDPYQPGAILTRVAASHIRIGTFQYVALRRNDESLKALATHVLERHYPDIDRTHPHCYRQLFQAICSAQAELIAQWMQLGFVHGVMNTDNMTVSGETIDYGPCAFIDTYRHDACFSSIDRQGRYALDQQPAIAQWNLARLAETLLTLFDADEKAAITWATQALNDFAHQYQAAWRKHMMQKLGFRHVKEQDDHYIQELLSLLEQAKLDYSLFFRALSHCPLRGIKTTLAQVFTTPEADESQRPKVQIWLNDWLQQLATREGDILACMERMLTKNPAVIARNHQVAKVIDAAESGDFAPFHALLAALLQPFDDLAGHEVYQQPPQPFERVHRTFCGT